MKRILCFISAFLLVFTALCEAVSAGDGETALMREQLYAMSEEELKGSVLRLHIVANSNNADDQMVKLALKSELTTEFAELFESCETREDALEAAENNTEEIAAFCEEYLRSNGFDYGCELVVTEEQFPQKEYDGLVFPEGEYCAVKVILGEGRGRNWWCVLYPPLCVYRIHTSEEYDKSAEDIKSEKSEIKLKWKLAELFK